MCFPVMFHILGRGHLTGGIRGGSVRWGGGAGGVPLLQFVFVCALVVYFTTLQLVLMPCGGGRTSSRTLP